MAIKDVLTLNSAFEALINILLILVVVIVVSLSANILALCNLL